MRAQLGNAYVGAGYADLIEDVKQELMASVTLARQAGIDDERIILDPGIGFGKKVEHNLQLINRLDEIRLLGFPVLLGPSRKSFIGYTLDLPPDQRLEGTVVQIPRQTRAFFFARTQQLALDLSQGFAVGADLVQLALQGFDQKNIVQGYFGLLRQGAQDALIRIR